MFSGCDGSGGGSETTRLIVDFRHFFLWLGLGAFDLACKKGVEMVCY